MNLWLTVVVESASSGPLWWVKVKGSEVAQSCPTLQDPTDCSPPGSSVHGVLQARALEWGAMSFSRGSSRPRDQTGPPALQADVYQLSHKGSPGKVSPGVGEQVLNANPLTF